MSTAGRGRPRASHADREQVIDTLKAAFVQGLLTKDELDARAGQAFASRTYAELAAVYTGNFGLLFVVLLAIVGAWSVAGIRMISSLREKRSRGSGCR